MKELFTEEQAGQFVFFLSIAVFALSLAGGFYLSRKAREAERKLLWANSIITSLFGPVIWIFWQYIYNPIENFYGLDSLKALKINFLIAIGFSVVFALLFHFVPRFLQDSPGSKRGKSSLP